MLRKRLEPVILEIPKGNYAPTFRVRDVDPAPSLATEARRYPDWLMRLLAAAARLFACSTMYLLLRSPKAVATRVDSAQPSVRLFWSQVFQPDRATDIVLDDAAAGLYQELTGRALPFSNYYDRAYLRSLPDRQAISSIVLRRQTSFSGANFLWKLYQMPDVHQRSALVRFARDYSFRELKANNAVLLGNSRSNPWNVLIIAGTGGSAVNAGAGFLADEQAVSALRRALPPSHENQFPAFEALIKMGGGGALPSDQP